MFLFYVLSASRNFGDVKAAEVLRPVVELYFQEGSLPVGDTSSLSIHSSGPASTSQGPPRVRMRSLWTDPLLAPRAVWRSRSSSTYDSASYVRAGGLNFFRSIVTFSRGRRPEFACSGRWNSPPVPSDEGFPCRARFPTSRASS